MKVNMVVNTVLFSRECASKKVAGKRNSTTKYSIKIVLHRSNCPIDDNVFDKVHGFIDLHTCLYNKLKPNIIPCNEKIIN